MMRRVFMGTTEAPSQHCSACGQLSPASAPYCMHCSQPFSPRCPSCGHEVPSLARFCPFCAHALNPTSGAVGSRASGALSTAPSTAPSQLSDALSIAVQATSQQAYLEGEAYLNAEQPEQALEAFERAI